MFKSVHVVQNFKDNNISVWYKNMLRYLCLDIICSSNLRKTVSFSEQVMSMDKCQSRFLLQMVVIVCISIVADAVNTLQNSSIIE